MTGRGRAIVVPLLAALALSAACAKTPSEQALRDQSIELAQRQREDGARTFEATRSLIDAYKARDEALDAAVVEQCRAIAAAREQQIINLAYARERRVNLEFEDLAWRALTIDWPAAFEEKVVARVEPAIEAKTRELVAVRNRLAGFENDTVLIREQARLEILLLAEREEILQTEFELQDALLAKLGAERAEFRRASQARFGAIRSDAARLGAQTCSPTSLDDAYARMYAALAAQEAQALEGHDALIAALETLKASDEVPSGFHLIVAGAMGQLGDEVGDIPIVGGVVQGLVDDQSDRLLRRVDQVTASLRQQADGLIEEAVSGIEDRLAVAGRDRAESITQNEGDN